MFTTDQDKKNKLNYIRESRTMENMRIAPKKEKECYDFHYVSRPKTKEFLNKEIFHNGKAKYSYTLVTGKGSNSKNKIPILRPYIVHLVKNNNKLYENNVNGWLYKWDMKISKSTVVLSRVKVTKVVKKVVKKKVSTKLKVIKVNKIEIKNNKKQNAWETPLVIK